MLTAVGKSVLIVEFRNGALHVEPFTSRLEAVLESLNSGALIGGAHGCDAHRRALVQIADTASAIIANIDREEADAIAEQDAISHAEAHGVREP